MTPEPLIEIPVPQREIPPCDVRYFTRGYVRVGSKSFWAGDWHKSLEDAMRDEKHYVLGTFRVFQVPEKEKENG